MMKKTVSVLLVLCFLLSAFTSFVSGETKKESTENKNDEINVLYNRNYSEGWRLSNGMDLNYRHDAIFDIREEQMFDYTRNYYAYVESSTLETNDYMTMNFSGNLVSSGKMFVEYDIKAQVGCDIGRSFLLITREPNDKKMYFQSFEDGTLYLFGEPVDTCDEKWGHISIIFDFSDESLKQNEYKVSAIYTKKGKAPVSVTKTYTSGESGVGISAFRLGYAYGIKPYWYGFDNFKVYSGVDEFTKLQDDQYGSLVKSSAPRDFEINTDSTDGISFDEKIAKSLIMKKNVEWCLRDGKRQAILEDGGIKYGSPREIDGKILVSLEAVLKVLGYDYFVHEDKNTIDIVDSDTVSSISMGRKSATVNGEIVELSTAPCVIEENGKNYPAVEIYDVEKLFKDCDVYYDSMGLITVSRYKDLLTRESSSLEVMMSVMKRFIFDEISEVEAFEVAKKKTNNFTHPYLFGNKEKFDNLRKVYSAKIGEVDFDSTLKGYIDAVVNSADKYFQTYAKLSPSEEYLGILPERIPVNRNYNIYGDGYDVGGRLNVPSDFLPLLAFAYQVTEDVKYAQLAYDWILAIGDWEHWGPGHFLNCADASKNVALTLDWIYDGLKEIGKDPSLAVEILYSHGVHMGYLATKDPSGRSIPFLRKVGGNGGCMYTMRDNNWNPVCTYGMIVSSLCILGESEKEEYRRESAYLISNNLKTLEEYGLQFYAPDGSYIESPGYWSMSTTSVFMLAMVLECTFGHDLGLMDCWGLDRTCYFAYNAEDNDLNSYQYHDANTYNPLNTSQFFYVGQRFCDNNIIAMRKIQLKNGKIPTVFDALYYVPDREDENLNLSLHYRFERCEGFVSRSSWERGASFAGIMAGSNSESHTQNDCGSFVYHNRGIVFIRDLGAENYNAKNFWGYKYIYYRKNSEGNNTLSLKSLKYGQEVFSEGKIVKTGDNSHGNYVIMDNTSVFGDHATYWKRGMLTTNDRNTVIIQDEVSFKKIESVYWFAHYDLEIVSSVKLSHDKRTAYLTAFDSKNGKNETVRIKIVSNTSDFHFEIMDCYSFVLDGTVGRDYSTDNGGQPEKSRDNLRKLAIKGENVLSFNVAVAIERIDKNKEVDVGYEWCAMDKWTPYADKRAEGEKEELEAYRTVAKKSDIPRNLRIIEKLTSVENVFATETDKHYRLLCDLQYACVAFENENLDEKYQQYYKDKEKFLQEYETFVGGVNRLRTDLGNLSLRLFGI